MPQEKTPAAESETKTASQMVQDMPDIFTGQDAAPETAQKPAETTVAPETQPAAGTQQTPSAATETAAAPDPFIERLHSLGFADVTDPASAQERLLQAFEQDRQRAMTIEQQVAQLQQQNLILQSQLTQRIQSPESAQSHAAAQPQAAADPWPQIPQMDMALQQAIKKHQGPDGGWLPTAPADVVAKAGQWEAAVAEWQAKLIFDPKGALEPIIEHKAKQLLQQMLGEDPRKFVEQQYETIQQQQTVEQQVASAWEEVQPWMFQAHPIYGTQDTTRPTEFGRRFQQSFVQAQEMILQINPHLDMTSEADKNLVFQQALQQTYFRHEPEIKRMKAQWEAYQQQQQAAPPPAAAAPPAAPPPPKEDPRDAMKRQHLERNRVSPANGSRGGAVETDERGRKRQKAGGLNRIAEDTVAALSGDGFFTP